MLRSECEQCKSSQPKQSMFRVNSRLLCEPCANTAVSEIKKKNEPLSVTHETDTTVCQVCKADFGSTVLPLIGNVPICDNCGTQLRNRRFPQWLKLSLAGLIALLVVALVHGIPYFRAGRSLVRGERALNRSDFQTATTDLQQVLRVAPRSQKAILLAAKAAILNCDIGDAQKALNLRTSYEQNNLFTEVNGLWNHAAKGYEDAASATKLVEEKHDAEGARLMRQASAEYPECKELKVASESYTAGADFVSKDYDGFLSHSTAALRLEPNSPELLGEEASALAAKYAVTGQSEFRDRAEEDLKKAEGISKQDPKQLASYQEYAERIRYRLDSREIIDRDEYNRRFRNGKDPLKGVS